MALYAGGAYSSFPYGEGLKIVIPDPVVPEDARAVIVEMFPDRVNWVGNPGFRHAINDGDDSWVTTGTATRVTTSTAQWSTHALQMGPAATATFGSLSSLLYAIPVAQPQGDDKPFAQYEQNLWKMAFLCHKQFTVGAPENSTSPQSDTPPVGIEAGFRVLREDGTTDEVITTRSPLPLPWLSISGGYGAVTDPAPVSATGWYCVYEVLDLGRDAVWALPFVRNTSSTATTLVTSVIAERWDQVALLRGPGVTVDVGQPQNQGDWPDSEAPVLEPWDYDWSLTDLLSVDPLVYFDGDSSFSSQQDFVYLEPDNPQQAASGYYPQRVARTQALRTLMRSWLPISRTVSVRYQIDRPRILNLVP